MSPMLNRRAIRKPKPREPLRIILVIMARGTTVVAFSISSLMCHAPSKPDSNMRHGNINTGVWLTSKREGACEKTNAPRHTVATPATLVLKIREDPLS